MGTFTMPSLGADMEAGTLVEWLRKAGDEVRRGDIVAVVETEKGAIEVEIFEDGRIEHLLVEAGAKVPVGTPLALVAGKGGGAPVEVQPPPAARAPSPPPVAAVPQPPPGAVAPASGAAVRASPAARRAAREKGIDLAGVTGTGPGGAVVRRDVAEARIPAPEQRGGAADLTQMRRAIAAAMARSKREIPHYYLTHSFDVTASVEAVDEYNASQPPQDRILLGALLIKAVALALHDYPEFNGFYDQGFRPSEAIHVGVAIAIRGGGLAAPAIHDADRLALPELMSRMRDLIARVRAGKFRSSEISDPTVTVSSLGDRGVETLLPIIYPPQVAIIGFGTPAPRPWIVENRVGIRSAVTVSLGADHRVSDGHKGALLLQRIAHLLESPREL